MPLYDQPVRVLLANMVEEFKSSGQTQFTMQDALAWFGEHYPKVKEGTIRLHLVRFSANDPNRLHSRVRPGEGLLFKRGPNQFRLYDPATDPPEILPTDETTEPSEEPDTPEQQADSEFAYERDLQHYLAKNLEAIEPGLRLWEDEDQSINGIEFDDAGTRMAWIEQHQAAENQRVRGVIIAREISEDLRLATSKIRDVDLYEYTLSIDLKPVGDVSH